MAPIPIDPVTKLFVGLETKTFSGAQEISLLEGAACPECGRAPTWVLPLEDAGNPERIVWRAREKPYCLNFLCPSRHRI